MLSTTRAREPRPGPATPALPYDATVVPTDFSTGELWQPGASDTEHEAMTAALDEARAAMAHGDVPVGAVVIAGGSIVARRHNERELHRDPTAHAEILALRDAVAILGDWRLTEATLVVTLEPCIMCAGAAVAARLGRLVYGAPDLKAGACGSLYNLCSDPRLNHEVTVVAGVREEESAQLLAGFFRDLRQV